jgi:hypothetical protein
VLRAGAALCAAFLLATFVAPADRAPLASLASLTARPLTLGEARRVGALVFLEGWQLSSGDTRFGGISAMHVEGGDVLALSDTASVLRFPLPRRGGALPLRIERLSRGPGSGLSKGDRDIEAMAVAGGRLWALYEGSNQIWRYRSSGWHAEAAAAMRGLSRRRGPEAMVRLADGSFLVVGDDRPAADGTVPLLLFAGDPAQAATPVRRLRYRPPAGYRPSDAALLADGSLLLLHRRWTARRGWEAVLTLAGLGRLGAGAPLEGRVVAEFTGGTAGDNMEALSVTREGGRTIVWIASDDNFNPLLQRTVLLKFALVR